MSRLISSQLDRFVTALWLERGLSDNTCQAYKRDVQGLDRWLSEQRKSDALAASDLRKGFSQNIDALPGQMQKRNESLEENLDRTNYRHLALLLERAKSLKVS